MSRYQYSYLLQIIFGSVLLLTLVPSTIYFACSLIIDNRLNLTSFILIISCAVIWILLLIIIAFLNKKAKNKVVFEKGIMHYKGRTVYKESMIIRYFKFRISFIEPVLVIPKLQINFYGESLLCYLSKRDIKKLERLDFKITKI